jgi:4-hydroxybenzoate polyprenyltransferase
LNDSALSQKVSFRKIHTSESINSLKSYYVQYPAGTKERLHIHHPLRRLIRFEAYGILFILAGIFGALLTGLPLDNSLVVLLVFIAASSAFGFVINDISDMVLDARAIKPRNPLADGSISCRTAKLVSGFFLLLSVACMALMPLHLLLIELAVLFVFVTYSFYLETKNIAGLDLVYHALFPALYGLLGYMLYHPPDLTGLVFFVLLGIFGAIGELANEIRDLEKDRSERKNTVVLVGERPGFYLMITLMVMAFAIIGIFSWIEPGFFWLLPFVPLGLILIHPVWIAMNEPDFRQKFVDVINTRAIVLAVVMLAVYGTVRFTGNF